MEKVKIKVYQREHFGNILDRYRNTGQYMDMCFGKRLITKDDFQECYRFEP